MKQINMYKPSSNMKQYISLQKNSFLLNIPLEESFLKTSFAFVFRRRLQDVFKTSWSRQIYSPYSNVFRRRFEDVLTKTNMFTLFIRLQDVLKTSSKLFQDFFKESSRRFAKTFSRRLQDIKNVFKVSSRCLQDIFKTSCKTTVRRLPNVFKMSCKNAFKTSSRHLAKMSSRRFQDVSSS